MFKRFDPHNDVSTSTQVKASVQRSLKAQLLEQHRNLTEEQLDALLPKKMPLVQYKVGPHLMLYCRRKTDQLAEDDEDDGRSPSVEPVLFQHRDGPLLPTLKLVHRYPTLDFVTVTVDKGAIPYLLGGAHVMCPGLTNPGGQLPEDGAEKDANGFDKPGLERGAGVVIYAEGKEHALAVGTMSMSSAEM
jgi:malignant T-cell-amplified sequence